MPSKTDVTVKVLLNHPNARMPVLATEGSACYDLYSAEDCRISAGETRLFTTGLIMEIPEGWEGILRPRSGMSIKRGQLLPNSPATIDSDYRGEVMAALTNTTDHTYQVLIGDRVCQIAIRPVPVVEFRAVKSIMHTERDAGGFGSTGK